MHGFLDELSQAFLTVQLGDTPLDFQIDTGHPDLRNRTAS
jgi:hypothetical protein